MEQIEYPALFHGSDEASNGFQRNYLRLVRAQYALLILAAICAMAYFPHDSLWFRIVNALIFFASIACLMGGVVFRPEQSWYKCRALAESVKTVSWRYMMKAAPFDVEDARETFRQHLLELFKANKETAEKITADWAAQVQLTGQMETVRSKDLEARKSFYLENRVHDQSTWYVAKAKANSRAGWNWAVAAVVAYLLGAVLVLLPSEYPKSEWPVEPVIVTAAAILGWIQVKKFGELTAAYKVTASEIGFLAPVIESAKDDAAMSAAINDAELAFSREHTLWLARQ